MWKKYSRRWKYTKCTCFFERQTLTDDGNRSVKVIFFLRQRQKWQKRSPALFWSPVYTHIHSTHLHIQRSRLSLSLTLSVQHVRAQFVHWSSMCSACVCVCTMLLQVLVYLSAFGLTVHRYSVVHDAVLVGVLRNETVVRYGISVTRSRWSNMKGHKWSSLESNGMVLISLEK